MTIRPAIPVKLTARAPAPQARLNLGRINPKRTAIGRDGKSLRNNQTNRKEYNFGLYDNGKHINIKGTESEMTITTFLPEGHETLTNRVKEALKNWTSAEGLVPAVKSTETTLNLFDIESLEDRKRLVALLEACQKSADFASDESQTTQLIQEVSALKELLSNTYCSDAGPNVFKGPDTAALIFDTKFYHRNDNIYYFQGNAPLTLFDRGSSGFEVSSSLGRLMPLTEAARRTILDILDIQLDELREIHKSEQNTNPGGKALNVALEALNDSLLFG